MSLYLPTGAPFDGSAELRRHDASILAAGSERHHAAAGDARAPALPEHDAFAVVTDPEELLALADGWRTLEREAGRPHNVFQSVDWCTAWVRHMLGETPCGELATIVGRRNGRLKLVWPLMIVCHGPFRVVKWLSDPYAQYGDVLISPDVDAHAWLDASWRLINGLPGISAIALRRVRPDAAAFAFLSRTCDSVGAPERAASLDLTAFPTQASYDSRYSREQRRRRARIRRRLEALGPVDFSVTAGGPDFDQALGWAITQKRRWLAERGLLSEVIADCRLARFLADLATAQEDRAHAVATVLTAGKRMVALEIGLNYGGVHFAYLTAHDTALSNLSPARLHMDFAQRWSLEQGFEAFDLMGPCDIHKLSWSNRLTETCDFVAPVSAIGRLYCALYLERIRPLLKSLYLAAPPRLRRLVAVAIR